MQPWVGPQYILEVNSLLLMLSLFQWLESPQGLLIFVGTNIDLVVPLPNCPSNNW